MALLRRAALLGILILLLHVTLVLGRRGGQITHSSFSVPFDAKGVGHGQHKPTTTELYGVRRRWRRRGRARKGKTVPIAGSRFPDCSHACGPCSPCRLVMVSLVCASLQEAETCPMAYKCVCNSKSYPVP